MLRLNFAIVWQELANAGPTLLGYVALRCCYRLARALPCFTILNTECYGLVIFEFFFFLIVGSAACPKEGTTNLHLDMSDAVNIMVSSHIVLFVSNFVRGTGWQLVKQTNCEAHSSLYIFKVKLSPALNPIQL